MLCLDSAPCKGPVHQVIHILIHTAAGFRQVLWKASSEWDLGTTRA